MGEAVEEATRLGVLERLAAPPGAHRPDELASALGISQRVVSSLMERLAAQGVAEEVAGAAQPPAYRLSPAHAALQRRRSGGGGGGGRGVQPKVGRPGALHSPTAAQQAAQQQAFMAGMLPYGFPPYHGQQLLYYPAAGLGAFQQPPLGGPPPGWHRPGAGGGPRAAGGPGGGGLPQMGVGPQHMGYPLPQPYYFAGGPMPPQLPPGSQMRVPAMPRAASGGSASGGSTGWGGVPLSQSPAEAAAPAPSPRSMQSAQSVQELPPAGSSQELPSARSLASNGVASAEAGTPTAPPPEPAEEPAAAAEAAAQPAAAGEPAGDPSVTPPVAPASSDEEERPSPTGAGSGTSSGGGARRRGGSSSGGSSGGSRRSRGSRERQPCAFFLKTGTCAYGDSCKFAHPFDKAPRVDFNSLGLPLRPGEPECAFYMKNYRCAFGHTCKFHHPELPPGAASPPVAAPMYALQYVQYGQGGASPMLGSVLGMKPTPGTPLSVSPGGPGHGGGYFLAPQPYPGAPHAFAGRPPAMHPGFQPMPAPQVHRSPPQRSGSGGSRAAVAATAAAREQQPGAAPAPAPPPSAAAADPGSAAAEPQPLMVFGGAQPAQQLASALDQLELSAEPAQQHPQQQQPAQQHPQQQQPLQQHLQQQQPSANGSGGLAGSLSRKPQQQVDVVAA